MNNHSEGSQTTITDHDSPTNHRKPASPFTGTSTVVILIDETNHESMTPSPVTLVMLSTAGGSGPSVGALMS